MRNFKLIFIFLLFIKALSAQVSVLKVVSFDNIFLAKFNSYEQFVMGNIDTSKVYTINIEWGKRKNKVTCPSNQNCFYQKESTNRPYCFFPFISKRHIIPHSLFKMIKNSDLKQRYFESIEPFRHFLIEGTFVFLIIKDGVPVLYDLLHNMLLPNSFSLYGIWLIRYDYARNLFFNYICN